MIRTPAAVLLCLALAACRPEADMPPTTDSASPPAAPGVTPTIQDVKRAHEAELMALRGVVSVGIGLDGAGNPAIMVGLDSPRAQTEPEIPPMLEGYPVVTQVVGTIRPL